MAVEYRRSLRLNLRMDIRDLRFFNPFAETEVTANRLPHWQQKGAVYFLTFRLADAIPKLLLDQWSAEREAWLAHHPQPWTGEVEVEYHRRFSSAMERWLDAGHGSCALRDSECRAHVEDALRHFDCDRFVHIAWVIMPNHVHVLFVPKEKQGGAVSYRPSLNHSWKLEEIVHSWKRHSAVRINRLLGRTGTFWQKDYFDRLVRDQDHFANCVRYIRRNPVKAKLREGEYTLYESDMVKGIP
jgi:putative transposase